MSFSLSNIDIYAQQLGSFLIAVLAFLYFSKRETAIHVLGLYGLNSVFFEILNLSSNPKTNIVGDIYTLTEVLILLYFFYVLFRSPSLRKIILVLVIMYCVLYCVIIFVDWEGSFSAIRMLRDLVIISSSLLYFFNLMRDLPTTEITRYPMFWVVAAFIFFFAGTFILSLSRDYLVAVLKDDLLLLWTARNFFRFFFCLVVSYGLWLDLRLVKMKGNLQR